MSTADRVLDILVNEGHYSQLPRPFKVGSISFDFTHALVAGERANDIVIVIELQGDTVEDGVVRKVMALTRALDVMRSKRPVTAVLTSGQPRNETIQSISKVCRVLPVGAPSGPDAIGAVRDWLSVLLPLAHQPAVETLFDWKAELAVALPISSRSQFVETVVGAAAQGKDAVEIVLADAITRSANAAMDEGDQNE